MLKIYLCTVFLEGSNVLCKCGYQNLGKTLRFEAIKRNSYFQKSQEMRTLSLAAKKEIHKKGTEAEGAFYNFSLSQDDFSYNVSSYRNILLEYLP